MIIGLVGGKPDLNQQLGEFLEKRYQIKPVKSVETLDENGDGDYLLLEISGEDEARWLHDEQGARLIHIQHPSNPKNQLQPLRKYCSFSIDGSAGFSRTRKKLEMTLTGCC